METDDKRHGGKEAAALSGGHLCHVCGYQYPNPHPSAKLRRSHRKHCGKALPAVEEGAVGVGVRVVGEREDGAGHRNRIAAGRTLLGTSGGLAGWRFALRFTVPVCWLVPMAVPVRCAAGREGGRQREETGTGEANGEGEASRGFAGQVDSSVEDKVVAAGNRWSLSLHCSDFLLCCFLPLRPAFWDVTESKLELGLEDVM